MCVCVCVCACVCVCVHACVCVHVCACVCVHACVCVCVCVQNYCYLFSGLALEDGIHMAYEWAGPTLSLCQTLAFLEVVHSAVGLVKGAIVPSLMQVCGCAYMRVCMCVRLYCMYCDALCVRGCTVCMCVFMWVQAHGFLYVLYVYMYVYVYVYIHAYAGGCMYLRVHVYMCV